MVSNGVQSRVLEMRGGIKSKICGYGRVLSHGGISGRVRIGAGKKVVLCSKTSLVESWIREELICSAWVFLWVFTLVRSTVHVHSLCCSSLTDNVVRSREPLLIPESAPHATIRTILSFAPLRSRFSTRAEAMGTGTSNQYPES